MKAGHALEQFLAAKRALAAGGQDHGDARARLAERLKAGSAPIRCIATPSGSNATIAGRSSLTLPAIRPL